MPVPEGRVHSFTPVYGVWPVCDLCGEREDAPLHNIGTVDDRLLRAIDTADKACTSMTAFGPVNDKWMRGFLAALAAEGLAVVEVEAT